MHILEQFRSGAFIDPGTLTGALIYGVLFSLIAWVLGRTLRLGIQRVLSYDKRAAVDKTAVRFLGQMGQIAVYVFAFISYTHVVPGLAGLGNTWLASASIISVIVGLAAQSTLGNLISGVALVLYRPFKVGDRLMLSTPCGPESGVVESVNLGYTAILTDDNRHIVVPNSAMGSQTILKSTSEDPRVCCSVDFHLDHGADIEKARRILNELMQGNPHALRYSGCAISQINPTAVVLTVSAWCQSAARTYSFKTDLLERARTQFAREGVMFARITACGDTGQYRSR